MARPDTNQWLERALRQAGHSQVPSGAVESACVSLEPVNIPREGGDPVLIIFESPALSPVPDTQRPSINIVLTETGALVLGEPLIE